MRLFPRGDRISLGVWLLLAAVGLAVYGNALTNEFVIDDKIVVAGDARVRELRVWDLLSGQYWPGPTGNLLYRPLLMLSFAANWAWSEQPWAFRLPNLVLHVGVAFMLFLLLRDWAKSSRPALIGSIVFMIHPIHTGPLNAIVDRAELGAAFFGLLAVWLWWGDGVPKEGQGWRRPLAAAVCFLVAAMFKENALTLAISILMLDFCGAGAQGKRPPAFFKSRVRRCYLPLIIALLAYFGARSAALGTVLRPAPEIAVVDNPIAHAAYGLQEGESRFLARWATPVALVAKAARLLIWPQPLCWDYSYDSIPTVKRWADPRPAEGAGWLLLTAGAMIVSYRRKRLVLFSLALAIPAYGIVSNSVVLIGSLFAERYLYLPSVGFCMLIGLTAGSAIEVAAARPSVARRLGAIAFIAVLLAWSGWCAARTIDRNRDWRSEQTLNAADLRTNPRSSRLWCAVATDALNAKDYGIAADYARRAGEICPAYAEAWRIAGLAYWRAGDPDRALADLERFFALGGVRNEQAVVAAASIAKTRGDYKRAISLLSEVVATNPAAATARNNLAWYLISAEPVELRDAESALRHAEAALALAPGQGDFVDTYISVLSALGRREEAARKLRQLLPTLPENDPYRQPLIARLSELQGR